MTDHARGTPDIHGVDLNTLIPHASRIRQVWFLRGGHEPDQVLVEWMRRRQGLSLTLWTTLQPRPPHFDGRWRGVALPILPWTPVQVNTGDVTSDGHPDILLDQNPGTNHDVGPHQVIATLHHGEVWRVFYRAHPFEMPMSPHAGMLAIERGRYTGRRDSVCCPQYTEKFLLRWNGHRYETASDRLVRNRSY